MPSSRVPRRLQDIVDNAQANLSTLSDLYDVDAMPPQLRKAHSAVDNAVFKLYRSVAFTGDSYRAEHLFELYEKLVAPLVAALQQTRGPRRKA